MELVSVGIDPDHIGFRSNFNTCIRYGILYVLYLLPTTFPLSYSIDKHFINVNWFI